MAFLAPRLVSPAVGWGLHLLPAGCWLLRGVQNSTAPRLAACHGFLSRPPLALDDGIKVHASSTALAWNEVLAS